MSILKKDFVYVDLFAGIGGFALAMQKYSDNSECLFASEINAAAALTYEQNFKHKPLGDIQQLNFNDLYQKNIDVVCAGFPCQTFSKGGKQEGFNDSRGTLFREIIRLIETKQDIKKRPKILILENVQNLINHDSGNTWKTIYNEISNAGYNVIKKPLVASPVDFKIPQLRKRAIILSVRKDIYNGPIDLEIRKVKQNALDISKIIQDDLEIIDKVKYQLSKTQLETLNCWNDFIQIIPKNKRVIGFPIWVDEFGLNYDISNLPIWKQLIIKRNRTLYFEYKEKIDKWIEKWKVKDTLNKTMRKFEWQAGKDLDNLFQGIIQFRPSGIRVKRPTEAPALVAMDHRPIYGPQKRYFTPVECLRLQSFPDNFKYIGNEKELFKQLGNAVNVTVIYSIFKDFINYINKMRKVNNNEHN